MQISRTIILKLLETFLKYIKDFQKPDIRPHKYIVSDYCDCFYNTKTSTAFKVNEIVMSKFLTSGCINGVKLEKVLLFGVWPFAVLTGDRINEVFFLQENVWPFFRANK